MSAGKKTGFAMGFGSPVNKLPLHSKSFAQSPLNKQKQRLALGDDDDDDDAKPNDELVVSFEDNQAQELAPKKEHKPLSIAPLANVDWRKQKQIYLPAQAQDPSLGQKPGGPEVLDQKGAAYGLQVPVKKDAESLPSEAPAIPLEKPVDKPVQEKSLETQAMEAIIRDATGEDDDKPNRVIPADETDLFRDDVRNRPDEATMDDYENMPVDEFGAALLRGLGWNEGEGIGRNRKYSPAPAMTPAVKQREVLLGLGAKPEEVSKGQKSNRRAAFEYKESSLFKKMSKRRVEEEESSSRSSSSSRRRRSRDRSRSPRSRSSSSSSSSSRRHRDDERSSRDRSHDRR